MDKSENINLHMVNQNIHDYVVTQVAKLMVFLRSGLEII
jgi:hypothetical protein